MNKVLVVTGGASGIGAAAATRLLQRGCEVHILDVALPSVDAASFMHCDLADPAAIDAAAQLLPERIDALVNVAGIAGPQPAANVMAVNFLGLRHLTELLVPRITDGGAVVNVASSAGRDWQTNIEPVRRLLDTKDFAAGMRWLAEHPEHWQDNPYKFSKQCAAAYTYRAAGLGVTRGVRVNCVNPGIVETPLSPAFRALLGEAMYAWVVRQSGRAGTPEDIAEVIEFLAVGECRRLNGVEITVDGGYFAGTVGGWINLQEAPGR